MTRKDYFQISPNEQYIAQIITEEFTKKEIADMAKLFDKLSQKCLPTSWAYEMGFSKIHSAVDCADHYFDAALSDETEQATKKADWNTPIPIGQKRAKSFK